MSSDGRDEDGTGGERADSVDDDTTVADIIDQAEPTGADETDGVSVRTNGADGASVTVDGVAGTTDSADDGAVAGSFAPDMAVTPGLPDRENVVFVALGAYLTIVALAQTVGVAPTTILGMTVAVVVGTLVCYGVLVRTTPDT